MATGRSPLQHRKLTRQLTLQERFDDASERLQRSLSSGRDVLVDAGSYAGIPNLVETFELVQQQIELKGEQAEEGVAGKEDEGRKEPAAAEPVPKRSLLEAVGRSVLEPSNIILRDKISFVLGVTNVAVTFFWLGRSSSTYYHYWVGKSILLFTLRWFTYKVRKLHYMMLEFCYAANLIAAIHLYFFPQSAMLRKLAFAHMAGPLMWSIVAMRNSLVLHDFDRMTTLMMHASPALVAWSMRWHPRPEWTAGQSPEQLQRWQHAGWVEMAVVPMAFYLAWVLGYYLLTFLLLAQRMHTRGYSNMFTHMVLREQSKKSGLARLVLRAPRALQPVVYLGMHMLASWLSILPTKLLWDHFWAHTLLLTAILLQSVWNGASFYFKVFAKRYIAELEAQKLRPAAGSSGAKGD